MHKKLIARVAHEVNRAYCQSLGDESIQPWENAPDWQKDSALAGVEMHQANPNASPKDSHESWMAQKERDGWVWGDVKDAEAKTHPCMLPYEQLPQEQRSKDFLFRAVVHVLSGLPTPQHDAAVGSDSRSEIHTSINAAFLVEGKKAVGYVGTKDFKDRLYGTDLTFYPGQVRVIPSLIAAKFLRHAEFEEPEVTQGNTEQKKKVENSPATQEDDTQALLEKAAARKKEETRTETQLQDLIDQVSAMDKEALDQFSLTNYRQTLDKRQSLDTLRGKVIGFINQYGAS